MNKTIKYTIIVAILLLGFKMAGSMDMTDHAILTMSQSEYDEIKDSLQSIHGSSPSDSQIAKEWYRQKGK